MYNVFSGFVFKLNLNAVLPIPIIEYSLLNVLGTILILLFATTSLSEEIWNNSEEEFSDGIKL